MRTRQFPLYLCIRAVFYWAILAWSQTSVAQGADEALAYQYASGVGTIAAYEKFISDYPRSIYAREANSTLKILKTIEIFRLHDQPTALDIFKRRQAEDIEKIMARYASSNDGGDTARKRIDEMIRRDDSDFYNFVMRQRAKEAAGSRGAIGADQAVDVYKTIFPDSPFAKNLMLNDRQVHATRVRTTEQAEWLAVSNSRDINKLEDFINKYPGGTYAANARQAIDSLRQAQDLTKIATEFQQAYASSDSKVIEDFLKKYPGSQYGAAMMQRLQVIAAEARMRQERTDYNKALLENKAVLWEEFIRKYPDSNYTTAAVLQLQSSRRAERADASPPPALVANTLPQAIVKPDPQLKKESAGEASKSPQTFASRRALVIGNDGYLHVNPLANAKNDAKAVAQALTQVGYRVTLLMDLNEKQLKQTLRNFKNEVEGGDEVLFYFAGHGVQIAGVNYLLPTDIKGDGEDQVKDEAIQLQRWLDDMAERNTKLALAVVDACRDNPFRSAGRALGGRGLAPTTPATGQMILFSAGSGQKALDNLGPKDKDPNGLFTRIFIKEIQMPGIPVDRILKNVRQKVVNQAKAVGHEQVPALYDQVIGEFYFTQ